MTHDELLAKIDWTEKGVMTRFRLAKALRAIVKLHRELIEHKDIPAGICLECGEKYPCPTIQAIEKELK